MATESKSPTEPPRISQERRRRSSRRRGPWRAGRAGAEGAQLPEQARPAATPVTPEQAARSLASETAPLPDEREVLTVEDPGSDFMVDVLKTLEFEYIAANPASSFRGLHESFINYGGNKGPEWLTCCHEAGGREHRERLLRRGRQADGGDHVCAIRAAARDDGDFRRVLGSHVPPTSWSRTSSTARSDGRSYDWGAHSVVDPAAMVRDMVKWDDTPGSLQHFAESAVRAYKMAMTEPRGPVLLVVDATLQENPVARPIQAPHPQVDAHDVRRRAIRGRWPRWRSCSWPPRIR